MTDVEAPPARRFDAGPGAAAHRGSAGAITSGFVVSDLMVVVLVVVAVAGVVSDRPELTALGTLVLVLALLSRVWARLALEQVTYRCEVDPIRAMEGDPVVLTLTLENRKPLPVPWLRVREHVPEGLRLDGDRSAAGTSLGGSLLLTTTALGPWQRVRLRFQLQACRRGHYVLGPGRLTGGDPFGFYESEHVVARAAATLVVLPCIAALPNLSTHFARPVGERARTGWNMGDPTLPVTVREYVSGDALRSVDWKTTARRGTPFVRINDRTVQASVVMLVECDTRRCGVWDHSPQRLESVVRAAAGLARDLLAAGHAVGMVANGVPPGDHARIAVAPGAGPDQLALLLDALARVQPVVVQPLAALARERGARVLPYGAWVVCVAAAMQRDTRELLEARRRQGQRVALLWLGGEAPDAGPGVDVVSVETAP